MSKDLTSPEPDRFGMTTFAELLSARAPILGEDPGTFDGFRDGLMTSLAPMTPYECVIAENLVAIEWELFQQRRMREAALRRDLCQAIRKAVQKVERHLYEIELDEEWDQYITAGGDADEWEPSFEFDVNAAEERSRDLSERAVSQDRDVQAAAHAELVEMELSPLDFMSEAYSNPNEAAIQHDEKVQELERRRRDVRRDYDALRKARPVKTEVEDAEVVEG